MFLCFAVCLGLATGNGVQAQHDTARQMVDAFEGRRTIRALRLARDILNAPTAEQDDLDTARLVEVFSLRRLRRNAEARVALACMEQTGPDLGAYGDYLRLSLAAARGDCRAADEYLPSLPDGSVYRGPAWARLSLCWLLKNQLDKAEHAVVEAEEAGGTRQRQAAVRLLRGKLAEAKRQPRVARDAYREVTIGFPDTFSSRIAQARLAGLSRKGFRTRQATFAEILAQADEARALQRLQPAIALYETIQSRMGARGKNKPVYQLAELGLAEVDIVNREYPKANARLAALLNAKTAPVRSRALYLSGDIQARRGHVRAAIATWTKLMTDLPDEPFAVEGALSGTRLAYHARKLKRARTFANWVLSQPQDRPSASVVEDDGVHRKPWESGNAHDQAFWALAWIERREQGLPAVVDSYLSRVDPKGEFGNASLYWRARIAAETGDDEAAIVFGAMLINQAPTSYYALAARDLLRRVDPAAFTTANLSFFASSPGDDAPQADRMAAFDTFGIVVLAEHGLLTEARAALAAVPVTLLSPLDRARAAWLYKRFGRTSTAAAVVRRVVESAATEAYEPWVFRLAFPRPFGEIVADQAASYGLPTELLYAVIREESNFNPRATSPRKARGLMQMIPPTARRMATDARLRHFRNRRLYEPEIAVQLGAHYLTFLLQQFDNNLVAAIASYHAGERSVARWIKSRGELPIDEFVEEIPIASTRRYVQKILRTYGLYRLLYDTNIGPTVSLSGVLKADGAPPDENPVVATAAEVSSIR